MIVESNKNKIKEKINEDDFLDKIIPLIIKNAPLHNEFKISDLENKLNLSKEEIFFLYDKTLKIRKHLLDNGYVFLRGTVMTLTDKGRDKKNGTEPHNRISKYQKIHIGLTIISVIGVFIFGYLNYSLNQDKTDLKNQNNLLSYENNQLKSDIAHYKDSINAYKEKALLKISKNEHDSLPSKN